MSTTPPVAPAVVAELRRLTRTELSMGARVAHVLLALAASAMTIVVASLWMTEPALPPRTTTAFGLLISIGLGWVTFSIWVLRSRRVLLVRHRVVAGRLSVSFSSVFVLGCLLLAFASPGQAAWSASAMGVAMLVVAVVLWRRAEVAHARLVARRNVLERELNGRMQ
jgi:hypothetical protein